MADREYSERLTVPLLWWVLAAVFLATIWVALVVATPAWVAWSATAVLAAATAGLLLVFGSSQVLVADGEFRAGPAHVALQYLGAPEALDAEAARRWAGVDADARAFLLLRPYIKTAVRIPVKDQADPTPYWLIATRRPDTLVAALERAAARH